jgi:AraC family carnitine catabolism transcriptional activator
MLKPLIHPHTIPDHFSLVLLPGFCLFSVSSLIECLRVANSLSEGANYRWSLRSVDGLPVMASSGLQFPVSASLQDLDPRAAIVLCGGPTPRLESLATGAAWLNRVARQAPLLIGLQGAVWQMARCGLLTGHRAAVHWELADAFGETFAGVSVSANLFEADRGRLTCAGGAAVVDMMLSLIARRSGAGVAQGVAEQLIHSRVRPGDEQQVSATMRYNGKSPFLGRAIEIMQENVEFPLELEAIARKTGCSRRQIERVFLRFVGISPATFYRNIRLDRGRRLLAETQMSCTEVAFACGFSSQGTFCRAYQKRFGATPFMELGRSKSRAHRHGISIAQMVPQAPHCAS